MPSIPTQLTENLTVSDQQAVDRWWSHLDAQTQTQIKMLWDARQDFCAYAVEPDETGDSRWHRTPVIISGKFYEEDPPTPEEQWSADYYEFLVNHPEIQEIMLMTPRIFHICTTHENARDVLKAGKIPADFICPFSSNTCPMLAILALSPGQSLYLSGKQKMG
ncbi:MAG: hypothetical protein HY774_25560 [Acidobacteria bacterium]|nr:hypothetical protein [Acidobacteriota bacterium]